MEEKDFYKIMLESDEDKLKFLYKVGDYSKFAKLLTAFSNTRGGVILIGVRENGKIVGTNVSEEYFAIENTIENYCTPKIYFDTQTCKVQNKDCLVVHIPEGKNKPYNVVSKIDENLYVRLDGKTVKSNSEIIQILNEKGIDVSKLFTTKSRPTRQLITTLDGLNNELINHLKNNPRLMYNLKPRQFEELVAQFLLHFGWHVELTQSTRDGGYDIYAISQDISGVKTHWLVECKKYAPQNKVGIEIVNALYGVKNIRNVGMCMIATTSFFTRGVYDFKSSVYDFETRDFNEISEWLNQYNFNNEGQLY